MLNARFITLWLFAVIALAPATKADESRGAYLAALGDCTACHTTPGHKNFAGGLPIKSPFGTIFSTNITPDKEFGIGAYRLEDFSRALRQGITKDGHYLYPAMPYTSYAGASDEDIAALYDYFMHEVAPVHEKPTETALSFPFNQRWGLRFWNMFFSNGFTYQSHAEQDASWHRGAYLLQTLGHCGACHTPRGLAYQEKGTPDSREFLTGATVDHWHSANLRGDRVSGLGTWSEDDIAEFLKTGHNEHGIAFGNMAQAVEDSTQYLIDEDRAALAHYLKSFAPGSKEALYPLAVAQSNELPGAGLYAQVCAACHKPNGMGKLPLFPRLAGNPAILSNDPTSVIRIILEGGKSPQTQTGPAPKKMPAFDKFTDKEIADVTNFIRKNWGNHASSVSERDVTVLRKALKE